MSVSELVLLFLDYCRAAKAPRTAEFYSGQLARLGRAHGKLPAAQLRPHQVLALGPTWHFIMSVQRLYRWACDEADLLAVNPVQKLRRPRARFRKRILGPAELAQLLRGARSDFRRFLIGSRESAARPQELRLLRWEWLRWDGPLAQLKAHLLAGGAYFFLAEFKARARRADPTAGRVIPITPRLGRLLWRVLAGRPLVGVVFLTASGQEWSRNSLRLRMRRLRERTGLAGADQGEKICCYTLRHSTATQLAADGMQANVLQQLLGHANVKTTARYIHLQRHQLLDSWKRFHDKGRDEPPAGRQMPNA